MKEKNIEGTVESRVCFQELEDWVREKVQSWVQELLEEEVTELLGRDKSERRGRVDPASGYRNGYGKKRRLTLSSGTITVRRPRVRDLEERFESRVLPLFAKRTQQVRDLIPELYLHGLAQGDFDLALRGLLGADGGLKSANTVARLKEKWQGEWAGWQSRPLEELEVVYLWADGIYVKAGLEKEKAVLLVVLAALSDGSQGGGFGDERLSGIDGKLVGGLARLEAAGDECSSSGHRRRPPGHLGSLVQRLPRGGRAALLESPHRQCCWDETRVSVEAEWTQRRDIATAMARRDD